MPSIAQQEAAIGQSELETIALTPHLLGHIAGKDKLIDLHSYWITYLWDSMEDRALQGHRGSYKTTSMAIGIVRWMLFHPDDRIAIIRKTFTDAVEISEMVRLMMETWEVKAIFHAAHGFLPKAVVNRKEKLVYNFKMTKTPEGNVNCHGLDASLTGRHYDKIWCDDFVTLKDRVSRAERERTKEVIREIMANIIDPGKPVIFTGTPWHRDDAWTIIPCPVIKYPVSATGLLTEADIARKKERTTPFLYSINYDLSLEQLEGQLFSEPVYGNWDYLAPDPVAHLDAAFDGDHFCALTIMARLSDTMYQAKGWVYAGNVKDWIPEIGRLLRGHRVKEIWNETNPDKGATAEKLRGLGLTVHEYSETQNKDTKIAVSLYEAWPNIVWDQDTDLEYMSMTLDWKMGARGLDDAPDSAASLLREWGAVGRRDTGALNDW